MSSPSNPASKAVGGRRRFPWAWGGVAITVALLAWVLHDVDPRAVVEHIRHARLDWLFLAIVAATLTFPIRTWRWQLMLRDSEGRPLPWMPLWHAVAIGFMANNVLPARAGEFARAYVAAHRLPVRFPTALASIAVERMLDGLVMLCLLALAVAAPSFPAGAHVAGFSLSHLAAGFGIGFGVALVVAFFVAHWPAPRLRLLGRILHALFPARIAERLAHIAEGLIAGLTVLRQPARFAAVLAWSLALWLVNGASFWLCFKAFAIPLPFEAALLLMALIGFGVAVPTTPGFWGVFEYATQLALTLYNVDQTLAVSYAVAYHITTFLPITLLGLYSLTRLHVRFDEIRAAPAPQPGA